MVDETSLVGHNYYILIEIPYIDERTIYERLYHPLVDVLPLDERMAVSSLGGCIIP